MTRVTTRNAVTRATVQGRPPSLADELAPIWSEISKLKARQRSIFPATVTDVDPVRIRIDGESRSLAATPDSLIPTRPGERVRVERYGTTHLILGRVGGLGAMLLDSGILPNDQYATLHIPQHLRGRFSHYEIILQAGADTTSLGVRPVSVRINGDDSPNYRSMGRCINTDGSERESYNSDNTAWPRTAWVGQYSGSARITLIPSNPRNGNYVTWHSAGWGHNGQISNFTFTAGGRYSGNAGLITHFVIHTNTASATWQDAPRARLWGYR